MDDRKIDKKTVYFAHPVTHYNTDLEWECINVIHHMLDELDIEIMNPNQRWLDKLYTTRKKENVSKPFSIFTEIVSACDIIVGVAFLDGMIGAGVAKEMEQGLTDEKEVYLISFENGAKFFQSYLIDEYRVLSIGQTRSRIAHEIL